MSVRDILDDARDDESADRSASRRVGGGASGSDSSGSDDEEDDRRASRRTGGASSDSSSSRDDDDDDDRDRGGGSDDFRRDQQTSRQAGGSGDPTDSSPSGGDFEEDQSASERTGGSGDPTGEVGTPDRSEDDFSRDQQTSRQAGGSGDPQDEPAAQEADTRPGRVSGAGGEASPFVEDRAADRLDDRTVSDVRTRDVEVSDGRATLTREAELQEQEARANAAIQRERRTERVNTRRGDDLPRTPEGVGNSEFRRDTAARDVADATTEIGGDVGETVTSTALDVAGADEGAGRETVEQVGASLGRIPGDFIGTAVDVEQSRRSVIDAGLSGGPGAAGDQAVDIGADVADAGLSGVDRLFDVDREGFENNEGALISIEDDARQEAAVTFTTTALTLPAGVAGGSAARGAAVRARSADPPTLPAGVRRFASDDRAQSDLTGINRRTGDETVRIEANDIEPRQVEPDQTSPRPEFERGGDIDAGDAFQRRRDQRIRGDRAVDDRSRDMAFRRSLSENPEPMRLDADPSSTGRFSQPTPVPASAEEQESSSQPNPGGLVVDDEGEIRDIDTRIGRSDFQPLATANADRQESDTETTTEVTTEDVENGVAAVNDEERATGLGIAIAPREDTVVREEQTPINRPLPPGQTQDVDITPSFRSGFDVPAFDVGSPLEDLITPTEQIPEPSARGLRALLRPRGAPRRPRAPDIEQPDTSVGIRSETLTRESVTADDSEGSPAASFGAETFEAFAIGGFRGRELSAETAEQDLTFELGLPTETLANPDPDEESAVEQIASTFGFGGGR